MPGRISGETLVEGTSHGLKTFCAATGIGIQLLDSLKHRVVIHLLRQRHRRSACFFESRAWIGKHRQHGATDLRFIRDIAERFPAFAAHSRILIVLGQRQNTRARLVRKIRVAKTLHDIRAQFIRRHIQHRQAVRFAHDVERR